jgi:K+-sensing histidine kinase KdpD
MEAWIWKAALGIILASLFYWNRCIAWIGAQKGLRLANPRGYIFATAYACLAILVIHITFTTTPMPGFDNIFLVGIAITAYFFTITPAAYLLLLSVAAAAWILPPTGSFAIASPADWYMVLSFAAAACLLILLTARLKKWSAHGAGTLQGN